MNTSFKLCDGVHVPGIKFDVSTKDAGAVLRVLALRMRGRGIYRIEAAGEGLIISYAEPLLEKNQQTTKGERK